MNMLSLIEELKNNFEVVQTNQTNFERIKTEWCDTHDKAVKRIVELLKEKGYTKLCLPFFPVPYIIDDREGNYQGVVSLCNMAC